MTRRLFLFCTALYFFSSQAKSFWICSGRRIVRLGHQQQLNLFIAVAQIVHLLDEQWSFSRRGGIGNLIERVLFVRPPARRRVRLRLGA